MAEPYRRTLKVSPNRVEASRERPYGGEAVQRLRSMVAHLQTRTRAENTELKQQEVSGSGSPAVRCFPIRLTGYRSDLASTDEVASMLSQHRKFVDQLREEASFYEMQLARMRESRGNVNTVDGEEQPLQQLPLQEPGSLQESDRSKEEIDTDGGHVIGLEVQPPANLPSHGSLRKTNTEVSTVEDRIQLGSRQSFHRRKSGWPEARAISLLQRERDDLLELCSALQSTLARFHGQEMEGQVRIRRALDAVQKAIEVKEQAEKSQKELLEQVETLKVSHMEELRCLQGKYESQLQGTLQEQQTEVACLSQELTESREAVERLNRQLETSHRELEHEKEKSAIVEQKRKQECEALHRQVLTLEGEHRKEVEQHGATIEGAAQVAQINSKRQQELEDQLKTLQHRLQTYERDCAAAQDKSCALQGRVSDLQKRLGEDERQNMVIVQRLTAAEEEKKELERTVHELQLQIHQTKAQAGDALSELGGLVEEQKDLTGRWKRESELLANQLQETTTRLQQQRKRECDALQEEVDTLEKKLAESQAQCVRHGAVHREMQQLLRETDQRAIVSQKQVLALLARQKNLLEERQSLCVQLDQLHQHVIEHNGYESLPS